MNKSQGINPKQVPLQPDLLLSARGCQTKLRRGALLLLTSSAQIPPTKARGDSPGVRKTMGGEEDNGGILGVGRQQPGRVASSASVQGGDPRGWDPQLLTNGKVKADVVFEVDRARRMQRV